MIDHKFCIKCEQNKDISFFIKNRSRKDGLFFCCKDCYKVIRKKYINLEVENNRQKRYGKKTGYKSQKLNKIKYPEKYKARNDIHNAVLLGKVLVPEKCQDCGNKTKLQAHHEDYSKPLDVKWLCIKCHNWLHHNSISVDKVVIQSRVSNEPTLDVLNNSKVV